VTTHAEHAPPTGEQVAALERIIDDALRRMR
jgi:hypothetical protein